MTLVKAQITVRHNSTPQGSSQAGTNSVQKRAGAKRMDVDRRVSRTQKALKDALRMLILKKHYDDITVQDIIDCANVGRATFYLHFRGKEELFRRDWESLLEGFIRGINLRDTLKDNFVPIADLFQLMKTHHSFYRALVKSGKMSIVMNLARSQVAIAIENKLRVFSVSKSNSVSISIMSNYLAREIFGLLQWWLENDMPRSPEQMSEVFHRLVGPGFQAMRQSLNERSVIDRSQTWFANLDRVQ
jgi:AcrR family transcriptional regulator